MGVSVSPIIMGFALWASFFGPTKIWMNYHTWYAFVSTMHTIVGDILEIILQKYWLLIISESRLFMNL